MAIVNNSPWKFMLAQEREAVDKLKEMKAYDGTEQDYDLMKSVHTVKGQYSEILVRYGESREVVKLFVDKQTQLVYSTDADDRTLVNSFKAKGFSIKDSLNMAHEHKNGKSEFRYRRKYAKMTLGLTFKILEDRVSICK